MINQIAFCPKYWFISILIVAIIITPKTIMANDDNTVLITSQWPDSLERLITCGSKTIDYTPTLEIKALFISENFLDRECAAYILCNGQGVDTLSALYYLINALYNEIEKPLSDETVDPFSYPITQCLRIKYIDAIARLLKNDIESITTLADTSKGELRQRLYIKLSDLGDSISHVKARELIESNNDAYLRLLPVKSINMNPDTLDIPLLIHNLNDNFHTINKYGQATYHIRSEVACALIKLGFKLERTGPVLQEYVITEEPNK